jgi:hypothetical protein
MIKLYYLERKNQKGWDVMNSIVVAAESSAKARRVAAENAGVEGEATWTNVTLSTCAELKASHFKSGDVICLDFNAG